MTLVEFLTARLDQKEAEMLADIAVKREIIRRSHLYARDLLLLLASVYSDHPNYNPEWGAVEVDGLPALVCRRCSGYGLIADFTNWDEYHGEPGKKPCPDCATPSCAYPARNHGDGRGCQMDDCPKHGHY